MRAAIDAGAAAGVVASCLWTPVSGVGMYAWVAVKAKVNRRGGADGGGVRVATAQAVQALGQLDAAASVLPAVPASCAPGRKFGGVSRWSLPVPSNQ